MVVKFNQRNIEKAANQAFTDLQQAKPQLFADLNVNGGQSKLNELVKTARDAAVNEVKNGKVTDPAAQKKIASETFAKVFRREAGAHLADSGRLGYAVSNSIRNVFGGIGDGFRRVVGAVKPSDQVVSTPPGWFQRQATKFPNWVGNVVKRHPVLAALGVTTAAVGTGMHYLSTGEKKRAEEDYSAQIQQVQAMQQQAYAMENAVRASNPYYGGVTAEEAATMEAQMRNGGQNGGFAAAERQRRTAAASMDTGPVA